MEINKILMLFMVLAFITVPIRTIIQNRRDIEYVPFIIGQIIYGMFWFGTYAVGMILIAHYVYMLELTQVIYLAFMYSFATTLGSLLMLFLQKGREADMKRKQMEAIKKKQKKTIKYKSHKGAKLKK